jgi:3-hydroxy-9,10-secoandrosta-1,3,5(10)-triene-9,17-dione monooxygenase
MLTAISEAAEEIATSRTRFLDNVCRMYDKVAAGQEITFGERAAGRRTQVRSAWRAVHATTEVVMRSGGNALRTDNPIQRFWRDAHMGLAHAIHVPGPVYHVSALTDLDIEPPQGPLRAMI